MFAKSYLFTYTLLQVVRCAHSGCYWIFLSVILNRTLYVYVLIIIRAEVICVTCPLCFGDNTCYIALQSINPKGQGLHSVQIHIKFQRTYIYQENSIFPKYFDTENLCILLFFCLFCTNWRQFLLMRYFKSQRRYIISYKYYRHICAISN